MRREGSSHAGLDGQLSPLLADVPQALFQDGDFTKPLVSAGLGEPVLPVRLDGVQPRCLGRIEPQERTARAGLTEMILNANCWRPRVGSH
jgi:hypothetical protein